MYKKEIMNETFRLNGRQPIARVSSKIRCRSAKKKLHRTRLFIVGTLNESLFCGVHAREDLSSSRGGKAGSEEKRNLMNGAAEFVDIFMVRCCIDGSIERNN